MLSSRTPRLRLAAAAFLLVVSAALPAGPGRAPEAFAEVVRKHFREWDRNRDGKLTDDELAGLIEDPHVKGTAAAAVVALHQAFKRAHKEKKPILTMTEGWVLQRAEQQPLHLGSHYASNYQRIARASREVFAAGAPRLEGLHQGREGDCYLVSPLGALAYRRPAALRKMISHTPGGGGYVVHFGNGDTVALPGGVTDCELALGVVAPEQGLWPNILEKAYGKLVQRKQRERKKPGGPQTPVDPVDRIGSGGQPAVTIRALTGRKAQHLALHRLLAGKAPSAAAAHALLSEGQAHGRVMVAGTGRRGAVPPGMAVNHAYAVLRYDASRRVLTLWNPWGGNFSPKGEAGPAHGYPTKGGVFEMPLGDFVSVYADLDVETAQPAR